MSCFVAFHYRSYGTFFQTRLGLFLLVMDNAIWHKSSTLKIPTNIGFAFIPPYTPEMNPIEQVWKEIRKRGFKNKAF